MPSPLARKERISTPSATPKRLPTPPARLTPPSTTAATTWNSKPRPATCTRRAEARRQQDAGDAGEQRADDEGDELGAADVVAGKPRHLGIAADGIELPAERAMAHEVDEGDEEDERDERRVGHRAEQAPVADLVEALEHQVVGDRLLAGVDVDAAADDEEAAERHDQRVDADIGGEVAVDDSDDEGSSSAQAMPSSIEPVMFITTTSGMATAPTSEPMETSISPAITTMPTADAGDHRQRRLAHHVGDVARGEESLGDERQRMR